jgi:uncharacterized protein YbcC (UPF0753/DUF2309 family)
MTTDIFVDHEVNILNQENHRAPVFDEDHTLHELKHYLPAQASLKDFIHHNTLHAFQKQKFHDGIRTASEILGYRVSLSIQEFRELYVSGHIRKDIVEQLIRKKKGVNEVNAWTYNMLQKEYETQPLPRIGSLRNNWKKIFRIDLDSLVHPILFRVLCAYLDQGIAMWNFPVWQKDFFSALREMEKISFSSFFRTELPRKLLLETPCEMATLLKMVVGDESLYEHYLFDQQFAHQGWSGMVSTVETQPEILLDRRQISIQDLIRFELLLEIDALCYQLGQQWLPLGESLKEKPTPLLAPVAKSELNEVLTLWQEAFEWTYYDEVLAGIKNHKGPVHTSTEKSFQGLFCIDDRECSFRRHLESIDPKCQTFSTPGFFGVEFYFQPLEGKFYTKVCPAPVNPKFLIKEVGTGEKRKTDLHFTKHTHSLFRGWLISQTLGFSAAFKLMWNIFRPTMSPATATSFKHMDKNASLTIEHKDGEKENGLQVGFTVPEMALRMENMLKSIGLVKDFAELVYIIGHGSSSVNNPHYAAYDCGACSGRPGSVNSRVACYMGNHPEVRRLLAARGIEIPNSTRFVGGLHDTTRDEIVFYDEGTLTPDLAIKHRDHAFVFAEALDKNAKERSRRLVSINSKHDEQTIHEEVRVRSVSLFEPRPELNHATNALCIVGRRALTQGLFLDRRAFMNSYDYRLDPDGQLLLNILKPAAPVCGGINLEYFFSRTDNQKLGAGTKLPHNVMGLIGVANGIDGDLRPGLPSQMIEVHDPIRLLVMVEHHPDVVLNTIQRSPETYEWFINDWVKLVAIEPETHHLFVFDNGAFEPYEPLWQNIKSIHDLTPLFEAHQDNLPVLILQ